MRADQLQNEQVMRIQTIDLNQEDTQRLFYLGFYPGAIIKRIQEAPMHDPILFQVNGNRLILRKQDARYIIGEEVL